MIRMGRSNKTEQLSDSPSFQENRAESGDGFYNNQPQNIANYPVSDGDSIARDIKEGRLSGYVGSGTVLTGETSFQAMLRIDGHLTGRITSESGTLIVGADGRVDANILVGAAVISGTVNGDIMAMEKIELGRTARVIGNIQAPRFVIEDGAVFEGNCSMLKAKEALEQQVAQIESRRQAEDLTLIETDSALDEENVEAAN